ncbi:hypothetical protein D0C36_11085 [Mucilaginibacter conchicola]|uniref:Lipoprotein n=1 Tax=Mucilaginibacter conchicola TaxID=2303333 RepID=A0A372NSN6_9SPHI|nr:hypothetical protein [Mucilaginibacter conchicola]RFZ91984.1 hypothetical protein D0C36_11085 [Mucilaginibacter conchicola]
MKKHILTLIAVISIFSACKKDSNNPGGGNTNGDYQPVTKGSNWTYETEYYGIENSTDKETATNTITGVTKTFDGKKYYEVKVVSEGDEETQYIGINNHVYTTLTIDGEDTFELPYFIDNKSVNESVITSLANQEGFQLQLKTTITEKGISKAILGKTYTNVVHTVTETQAKQTGAANFTTTSTTDTYVAKGVGVIAIYAKTPTKNVLKSELKAYVIK